jgi:hypothetical protein
MFKKTLACMLVVGAIGALPAAAADEVFLARFKGGIGVIPVSSGVAVPPTLSTALTVESVNRNIVRGVQPPGQIWVIADLKADVTILGRIKVKGKGLLLGGGNNIGTNAGQSVRATLLCTNDGNILHDSGLVPLEPNGDFRIDATLAPPVPSQCIGATLLIRNPAGSWFAAGIPNLDNDSD